MIAKMPAFFCVRFKIGLHKNLDDFLLAATFSQDMR